MLWGRPPALRAFIFTALLASLLGRARAYPKYQDLIPNGAGVRNSPGVGHVNPQGTGKNNAFGLDFAAAGRKWTKALCEKDSDGDGFSNGVELGDPGCLWSPGETPTFNVGLRHPGVPEGSASAQYKSCEHFHASNISTTNFTFDGHDVRTVETDYVCQKMQFPADRKRWVRKLSPIVEHPKIVHHMIVYACEEEPMTGYYPMPCPSMSMSCQTVLYAWAVGAKDLCLPDGVGFPVGIKGMTHMLLEIHYDNPNLLSNVADSSGVSMTLTDIAPTHEAGIMMFGDPGFSGLRVPDWIMSGAMAEGIHIPPGQAGYEYSTDCPSACTDLMIQQPLTVIATGGHAHTTGVAVKVDRIPSGSSTPLVIFDEPDFDFDLQQLTPMPPNEYKTIMKGDRLRVHCTYDTTRRSDDDDDIITTAGLASDQEMCLGLLVYYPRMTNGANCFSGRSRTNHDSASSYAVCSFDEYFGCACDNPSSPATCREYYPYVGHAECVAWHSTRYNTSSSEAARACGRRCNQTSQTFPKFLNSRDGTSPLAVLRSQSALLEQYNTLTNLAVDVAQDCEEIGGVVACNDKCVSAIRNIIDGSLMADVGVSTAGAAISSAMSSFAGVEYIIGQLSETFKLMKQAMMTCSLCTSSQECPTGNLCYCDAEDTRLCRCVNEVDGGGKDSEAVIFQGFPFSVDKALNGTWTSLCEPRGRMSVRESYTFFGDGSTGRVFQHDLHEFDDHKCTKTLLVKDLSRTGTYSLPQGNIASAKGSAVSGPLELALQTDQIELQSCPTFKDRSACRDHSRCIPDDFFCDGYCDCEDGSDELDYKDGGQCNHTKFGEPRGCPLTTPDSDTTSAREPNTDTLLLLFQVGSRRTTDADFQPNVRMQVVSHHATTGISLSYAFYKYFTRLSGYGGNDAFDAWVAVQDKMSPPFSYGAEGGQVDTDDDGQDNEGGSGWQWWVAGGVSGLAFLMLAAKLTGYGKQCFDRIRHNGDSTAVAEASGSMDGGVAVDVNNPLGQVEMQETMRPFASSSSSSVENGIARGVTAPAATWTPHPVAHASSALAPPSKKKKKKKTQNYSGGETVGTGGASVALKV